MSDLPPGREGWSSPSRFPPPPWDLIHQVPGEEERVLAGLPPSEEFKALIRSLLYDDPPEDPDE